MAFSCALVIGVAAGLPPAWAATAPPAPAGKGSLQDARMLDARVNLKSAWLHATDARPAAMQAGTAAAARQAAAIGGAVRALRLSQPGLQIKLSGLTGAPAAVSSKSGPLTGPAPGRRSEDIVRDFLRRNGAVFGLGDRDLADLAALGDSAGGRSGLRMLRMEQRIDGRPVFQSETRFLLDRDGRLHKAVGQLVPEARARVDAFDPAALIDAPQALAALLESSGRDVSPADFSARTGSDGRVLLESADAHVLGEATARQVLFPLAPGVLVPAWSLVAFTDGDADWYAVVDAETGDLLWRKNIRAYASNHDARFRVYVQADGRTPADNPAPQSPTLALPGGATQPAEIAPSIVSMHAVYDAVASPNGWIDDCPGGVCSANETQTLGNNVLACLDRAAPANVCDTDAASLLDGNGRPTGNPDANARNRDFLGSAPRDFETGYLPPPQGGNPEAGQSATGAGNAGTLAIDQFRRGAVTHLFYLSNWYHDELFALGFDEASGNFQNTNFSGMGLGGDRVLADAQDASGTNNANFGTPPDGISGRMQMFRFTGATIDRDGGLDAEIAIHELTHGTSNRLVGNAAGLNWDVAAGMGEGWSDFYALSLLNNTNADDPDGNYAAGSYATYKLGGLLDNYVYAIRRFPYSTDNAVNPMTWADADDATNDLSGGIAPSPLDFNGNGAMEVHNSGEIWALTLWEVRSRIIADPAGAAGDVPAGNQTMLQLVTDALKMTPIDPSFVDARDALFDADCASNACANEESIWGGFADRGLGYGAHAPIDVLFGYTGGHAALRESFELPRLDVLAPATDVVLDDSGSNNNGALDPGEAVRMTVRLTNPWRAASKGIAGATATLTSATPGVTIYDGSSTYGAIAAQGDAIGDSFMFTLAPGTPCGSAVDFTLTTTSALGTTQDSFTLRVGAPDGTAPVVTYTATPSLGIPDNYPHGVKHDLAITDDFVIADLDFRLDNVAHTFPGDLAIMLRSPGGVGVDQVSLIGGLTDGGSGDNMINMVADDDVPVLAANDMVQATSAAAPYTRSWLPVFNGPWTTLAGFPSPDPVGAFSRLDGASTKGTWTVVAADEFAADAGTLNGYSLLVTPVNFSCAAFAPSPVFGATKAVAGSFSVGGTVTYTVTLTNTGAAAQADNAGNEFTDVLPAGLSLVGASATSGTASADTGTDTVTWNGALIPLGGSVTITITATVDGTALGTTVSNQGTVSYDSDGNGSNDAQQLTDDPGTAAPNDPTSFIVPAASLTASKSVAGSFTRGGAIVYTVTISNAGNAASSDSAADEFTDVLPAGTVLSAASASSGTAVANVGTNTVTWNGSVPAGGSVTLTIDATVAADASGLPSNQGTLLFDADFDGDVEPGVPSDSPDAPGNADPTVFEVLYAQIDVEKTVAGTFLPGQFVTYTMVLENTGNRDAADNAGHEFTDPLSTMLDLDSANASSGTLSSVGDTLFWDGAVAAGASVTITLVAQIEAGASGTIGNQASASYDADLNESNETTALSDDPALPGSADPTTFSLTGADLQISKSNGTDGVLSTTETVYTIQVGNGGPEPVIGAHVVDLLPPALLDAEWTCSAVGATCPTPASTGNIDVTVDLPVDAVMTFQVIATVSESHGDSVSNTATVATPANIPELDASDNSATDTDGIQPIIVFKDGFEDEFANAPLATPPSAKTRALGGQR